MRDTIRIAVMFGQVAVAFVAGAVAGYALKKWEEWKDGR